MAATAFPSLDSARMLPSFGALVAQRFAGRATAAALQQLRPLFARSSQVGASATARACVNGDVGMRISTPHALARCMLADAQRGAARPVVRSSCCACLARPIA